MMKNEVSGITMVMNKHNIIKLMNKRNMVKNGAGFSFYRWGGLKILCTRQFDGTDFYNYVKVFKQGKMILDFAM